MEELWSKPHSLGLSVVLPRLWRVARPVLSSGLYLAPAGYTAHGEGALLAELRFELRYEVRLQGPSREWQPGSIAWIRGVCEWGAPWQRHGAWCPRLVKWQGLGVGRSSAKWGAGEMAGHPAGGQGQSLESTEDSSLKQALRSLQSHSL